MNNKIKEMAKKMNGCSDNDNCKRCRKASKDLFNDESCAYIDFATALYEAGYRKQSDTVREFAEKAFRVLKKLEAGYKPDSKSPCDIQPNNVFTVINIELNELAAEYGVEVE